MKAKRFQDLALLFFSEPQNVKNQRLQITALCIKKKREKDESLFHAAVTLIMRVSKKRQEQERKKNKTKQNTRVKTKQTEKKKKTDVCTLKWN